MNPTTDVLEKRMMHLEGGVGAMATSSGSAAISYAIMNICRSGDHLVSSASLYGGTYNLFRHTLPQYGIETTFVDSNEPENIAQAITGRTKCVFVETIGNPRLDTPDFEKIAAIAHRAGNPAHCRQYRGHPLSLPPLRPRRRYRGPFADQVLRRSRHQHRRRNRGQRQLRLGRLRQISDVHRT